MLNLIRTTLSSRRPTTNDNVEESIWVRGKFVSLANKYFNQRHEYLKELSEQKLGKACNSHDEVTGKMHNSQFVSTIEYFMCHQACEIGHD